MIGPLPFVDSQHTNAVAQAQKLLQQNAPSTEQRVNVTQELTIARTKPGLAPVSQLAWNARGGGSLSK